MTPFHYLNMHVMEKESRFYCIFYHSYFYLFYQDAKTNIRHLSSFLAIPLLYIPFCGESTSSINLFREISPITFLSLIDQLIIHNNFHIVILILIGYFTIIIVLLYCYIFCCENNIRIAKTRYLKMKNAN